MDKLGLNAGYLLFYVLNFILLLVLLYAWVYKPILGMLNDRKQQIAQSLEDARQAAEARKNAEKDAARLLADAQAEANKRRAELITAAEKEAAALRAAAEDERRQRLKSVEADSPAERNRLLGDLRGQVAALAIAAANKVIGETLDERRQRALIDELFSGVKAGQVVVLEGETVSGQTAVVTSALPLTAQEQETVRTDMVKRLGGGAQVTFHIDPDILGGLVVRVGDKLIDGSVAGKLEGLRVSLMS